METFFSEVIHFLYRLSCLGEYMPGDQHPGSEMVDGKCRSIQLSLCSSTAPLSSIFPCGCILHLAVPDDLELRTSPVQFDQGIISRSPVTKGVVFSCLVMKEWGRRSEILTTSYADSPPTLWFFSSTLHLTHLVHPIPKLSWDSLLWTSLFFFPIPLCRLLRFQLSPLC